MERSPGLSRKKFLVRAGVPGLAAAVGVPPVAAPATERNIPSATRLPSNGPGPVATALTVNGERRELTIEPRVTLLDALREYLGMTGTKKGCGQGTCGACTVLVNGRRVDSCLTLALMHRDDRITTIEGLAHGDELHPMQAAFPRTRRFSVRILHPGSDRFGGRAARRETPDGRVEHPGSNEREHLPLRRVREYRCRDPLGSWTG